MQKYCAILFAAAIIAPALHSSERDRLLSLSDRLAGIDCYTDSCTYEILLPSLAEPVTYFIRLETSASEEGDTLAPCNYIISWGLPTPSGLTEGFSAYFKGNHFRFRDKRMQEYHAEWDPAPFAPGGKPERGVQSQVQFSELLPQFIAAKFRDIADDSTQFYRVTTDTIVSGRKSTVVRGISRINGYDGAEYNYVFDNETLFPVQIQLENNPGQIGEQSISVAYTGAQELPDCKIDMETLSIDKKDAFDNFRESSFSLENLPGQPLPRITAPTTTGERYSRNKGDAFASPTVIAFLDATIGSTPEVIVAVRKALDFLPMHTDVIWAFINHRADDIDAVIERPRPGEHILMNAKGAAGDCGVGDFTPVLIFTGTDGIVRDFIKGYNNDLESLVIQKTSLCN